MEDLSEKCKRVLETPLTKEICFDFREIRRRAMCETWRIIEEQKLPFREARKLAWDKVKDECAKIGAII